MSEKFEMTQDDLDAFVKRAMTGEADFWKFYIGISLMRSWWLSGNAWPEKDTFLAILRGGDSKGKVASSYDYFVKQYERHGRDPELMPLDWRGQ